MSKHGELFRSTKPGKVNIIDLIFPHEDEIAQNCVACRRVMLATGCIMVLLTKMVRRYQNFRELFHYALYNELETNLADDLHTPTILKDAFQDAHKLINTYLISPRQFVLSLTEIKKEVLMSLGCSLLVQLVLMFCS
ncbi:hypothetical protein R3W88_003838 [Solanum pinnatisectum]|uniref:Uncharacterized protein n=1 Tax=Solanum pinnatisectum TaxID=50273 RepID=A0AAV9MQ78_9SOLN|nr:hypothetical protein R3W88_003838 [Solanum pinnatisectum]